MTRTAKRRAPKKPQTSFFIEPPPIPDWSITDPQWREVEEVYRHAIPTILRDKISDIISDYIYFSTCEANRFDSGDSIKSLSKIERAALSLIDILMAHDAVTSSTVSMLRDYEFFDEDSEATEFDHSNDRLARFIHEAEALVSATRSFTDDSKAVDAPPHRPSAWDKMACLLVDACAAYNLPAKATKGSGLDFVALFLALQKTLPLELRKHHSIDGIERFVTEALSLRARRTPGQGGRSQLQKQAGR
ncbi:hypothetical protein [Methylosinus sp. KRF6]|uniref:hypothetical protein n=1 Tax=Methylosinus sp. KRF6 TaxID=2846853 RepID=UPI001C0D75D8|nr:hypothetical protein [Methylosinus sp. KRF6]MBU3887626.1 hypothetical protein [Methylosinus sp. KRF6]